MGVEFFELLLGEYAACGDVAAAEPFVKFAREYLSKTNPIVAVGARGLVLADGRQVVFEGPAPDLRLSVGICVTGQEGSPAGPFEEVGLQV